MDSTNLPVGKDDDEIQNELKKEVCVCVCVCVCVVCVCVCVCVCVLNKKRNE